MTTLRDRIEERALSAYTATTMARMPSRQEGGQWVMTVEAVTDVAAHVRRITFSAAEFRSYVTNGADEYFGLLIPRDGRLVMPDPHEVNLRRAVHRMPEDDRPELRWYTLRAVRPEQGEVDVDIVLHGDAGPGSAWATRVAIGEHVGFRQHTALHLPPATGHQLLIADETGAPALAAILESLDNPAAATVLVEVPDLGYLSPLPDGIEAIVVQRGDRQPGEAALERLTGLDLPALSYAWICGEHTLATGVRRHLVKERDVNRRSVMFSSFWTLGEART